MLWLALILELLVVDEVLTYNQTTFRLKFTRAEKVRKNPAFGNLLNISTFKYNRTYTAMNTTFDMSVDMHYSCEVEVQAYKFLSNEYRQFPLRFSFNVCEALAKNDFGSKDVRKCGNFTGCPLKKGTYHICNWAPDASKFPPFIPSGDYMVDMKFFFRGSEIALVHGYATVEEKYPWEF